MNFKKVFLEETEPLETSVSFDSIKPYLKKSQSDGYKNVRSNEKEGSEFTLFEIRQIGYYYSAQYIPDKEGQETYEPSNKPWDFCKYLQITFFPRYTRPTDFHPSKKGDEELKKIYYKARPYWDNVCFIELAMGITDSVANISRETDPHTFINDRLTEPDKKSRQKIEDLICSSIPHIIENRKYINLSYDPATYGKMYFPDLKEKIIKKLGFRPSNIYKEIGDALEETYLKGFSKTDWYDNWNAMDSYEKFEHQHKGGEVGELF